MDVVGDATEEIENFGERTREKERSWRTLIYALVELENFPILKIDFSLLSRLFRWAPNVVRSRSSEALTTTSATLFFLVGRSDGLRSKKSFRFMISSFDFVARSMTHNLLSNNRILSEKNEQRRGGKESLCEKKRRRENSHLLKRLLSLFGWKI